MEDDDEPTGAGRRSWGFVLAAGLMCLGAWTLTVERPALGVAQVLLGLVFLVTALGPKRKNRPSRRG